jgi:hypothetical protein
MPLAIAHLPSVISRAGMLLGNAPVCAIATAAGSGIAAGNVGDLDFAATRALRVAAA